VESGVNGRCVGWRDESGNNYEINEIGGLSPTMYI
jgi:hypothetical protein